MQTKRLLTEAFAELKENILGDINCCLPAIIDSYDHNTCKAQVEIPLVKRFRNGETTNYPAFADVPVMFPTGSDCGIRYPLNKGDSGILLFADRAIDRYIQDGEVGVPDSRRKHAMSDAIFIPGLVPFANQDFQDDNESFVIKYLPSEFRITGDGKFQLKKNSVELLSLINDTLTQLIDAMTSLATATAGGNPLVPGGTPFATIQASLTQIQTLLSEIAEV